MKKLIIGLAGIFCASSALAEFRQAEFTKEMVDELARRCQLHAKNDRIPLQLYWGRLEKSQYRAEPVEACDPKESEQPCEKQPWFPEDFTGYFVDTNLFPHKPRRQVKVKLKDFHERDLHSLSFELGKRYAFCATLDSKPSPRRTPILSIHNYFTIYALN